MPRPKIIIPEDLIADNHELQAKTQDPDSKVSTDGESPTLKLFNSLVALGLNDPGFQVVEPEDGSAEVLIMKDTFGSSGDLAEVEAYIQKCRVQVLLYHMSNQPNGDSTWDLARKGPFVKDKFQDPENLVVVVTAEDLRARGIGLSRSLSWEKTCEEFVGKLGSVGSLVHLITCTHLVVLYDCDGAIYHRGSRADQPILFFDAKSVEGEFAQRNPGSEDMSTDAFILGLAAKLAQKLTGGDRDIFTAIEDGIRSGLSMSRHLLTSFTQWRDLDDELRQNSISRFSIPSDDLSSGANPNWSILDYTTGNVVEVARRIVRKGVKSTTTDVPFAQLNDLILLDRREIESFRAISRLLHNYLTVPNLSKPLNVAIFGPKGSGKSFAAMQISDSLNKLAQMKDVKIQRFYFDFSRFMRYEDAVASLHAMRQCSLGNKTLPVMFFRGFDVKPLPSSEWIPHLLNSILQGRFWDQGQNLLIGRGVFLFESTRSKSLEEFRGDHPTDSSSINYLEAEELLSHFHGYINMLGPDCVHDNDELYPVRRAVILRKLLEEKAPKLIEGKEEVRIDQSVLDGLLITPRFRQSIRSLKVIIEMSSLGNTDHFRLSHLPSKTQLHLHVDYNEFERCINGQILHDDIREILAERLNDVYLEQRRKTASTQADFDEIRDMEWNYLDEERRESTRIHADAIPGKLQLVSCFLSKTRSHSRAAVVEQFEDDEVERLAEAEHDRWNAERMQKQWRRGPRKPEERQSPFLVPWSELSEYARNLDRVMVACYPRILPPGYKIYRFGETPDKKHT
jgi:RyR domain